MGVCGSKREGKPAAAEKYSRDDPKLKDTILEVLEEALPRLMPQKVTHVHKTLVNVNNNVEANQMLLVNNPDPPNGQPQPDERITQAEYEKVVKGARLTDPVEEPISRTCKHDHHPISALTADPSTKGGFYFLCGAENCFLQSAVSGKKGMKAISHMKTTGRTSQTEHRRCPKDPPLQR